MSTNRYTESHKSPKGPGDDRPTALQIIKDEGLEGKMTDKIMLITGVSAGIGVETARALAATGATIYGTVRNLKKGQEALSDILSPGKVELLLCDLSSLDSVRACAEDFLRRSGGRLNVLVTNAGVMGIQESTKTVDGFDMQFGTNHLAHFLLFQLLKPTLLKSSTAEFHSRVVALSSSGHRRSEIHFDDINLEKPGAYSGFVAYGQAKTANIYMANYIHRHYGHGGLHGLAVHPGGIWSGLQIHVPAEMKETWKTTPSIQKIMKSTEQGAATTVLAAVGKEYEGKGRVYLEDSGEWGLVPEDGQGGMNIGYAKHAFDEEKEDRLWKISCRMVGVEED